MSAELLSPAGDFETALSAFEAGADAVYCGLSEFSARAFAVNFSIPDLKNLLRYAHAKGKKVYVTFNTVIDEDRRESVIEELAQLEAVGPDGVIVQDLGVARLCRRHFPGLALHASTQLVAHNLEGVLALREIGFTRVVLARELSLEEISSIARKCGDTELEVFIHGALCYSLSGLCLFGAMEKGRSGNRGKCPYCCRECHGGKYPFSMKDLRLGEDVRKLADAGVASLKIEGRMKSALYVESVTQYYRNILDGNPKSARRVTLADLETVFSRRTTELRLDGDNDDVIDPDSLGHLGTPIGTVKRITKDREGRSWLRFHTARALEVHDGLQFSAMADGRHVGMGIREMRSAISRTNTFEVAAGTDVEIALPEEGFPLRPGDAVYCSMSNAVKRMFPTPSFRPSDYPGLVALDVEVTLSPEGVTASVGDPYGVSVFQKFSLDSAKSPDRTYAAVEKAFSKFGETDYRLGKLALVDPDRRFVPASVLNDVRRDLVEEVDGARDRIRRAKTEKATADVVEGPGAAEALLSIKLRPDQKLPDGDWSEIVYAINPSNLPTFQLSDCPTDRVRLALPVFTGELEFNKLRSAVKRLLREGYVKWECSDLATLRMLRQLGVEDITADWSLYAFNGDALAELSERGVRQFVASPENGSENLAYLAESGYRVEFLKQQSTPLFISIHRPAADSVEGLSVFQRDGLWVTTKPLPRTFVVPRGTPERIDLSWSAE